MTDITPALQAYIDRTREQGQDTPAPPYVDLVAPDIILHLRVRLKVGSDDVEILDDDTPALIASLNARVSQLGEDQGRQNTARDNRLEKLERESKELYTFRLNDCVRLEHTRDKAVDCEARLNMVRDQISNITCRMARPVAVVKCDAKEGEE